MQLLPATKTTASIAMPANEFGAASSTCRRISCLLVSSRHLSNSVRPIDWLQSQGVFSCPLLLSPTASARHGRRAGSQMSPMTARMQVP